MMDDVITKCSCHSSGTQCKFVIKNAKTINLPTRLLRCHEVADNQDSATVKILGNHEVPNKMFLAATD